MKNYLLIINKTDKPNKLQILSFVPPKKILRISAKNQQIGNLEAKINELFASDVINKLSPYPYLSQS